MNRIRFFLMVIVTILYPFLVYSLLGRFDPKWIAFLLLVVALLRAIYTRQRIWWVVSVGALVLGLWSFWHNDALPLKLYPVVVSLVMLSVFGFSLIYPPTVIERLARLQHPELPPSGVRYTRRVTQVWCGFFIVNAIISLDTVFNCSDKVWALYNGLIAYLLMGGLFFGEWCVRPRMVDGTHD